MIVPLVFTRANVAANLNNSPLLVADGAGEIIVPFDGYLVALSVISTEAVAVGSLAAEVMVNGSAYDDQVILEAAELREIKYYRPTASLINHGQYVGVRIDTSADFEPVTADITVVIWVSLLRNDPPAQYWT